MPKGYTLSSETGSDSEYESDDGEIYRNIKKLGSGTFSVARQFRSVKEPSKSKVVLSPVKPDFSDDEVSRKYNFFKKIYPQYKIELFKRQNTYRLVLPLLPGIEYKKLDTSSFTEDQQIVLFISAIDELLHCHKKNLVFIDLSHNNILYHHDSNRSYLIDGGSAVNVNEPISLFTCSTLNEVLELRKKYAQIAPECWSIAKVLADKSMDIYSLGNLMKDVLKTRSSAITSLINQCKQTDPNKRPNLDALKNSLINLLSSRVRSKIYPVRMSIKNLPIHTYSSPYSSTPLFELFITHFARSIPTIPGLSDGPLLREIAAHLLFAKTAQGRLSELSYPPNTNVFIEESDLIVTNNTSMCEKWRLDKLRSVRFLTTLILTKVCVNGALNRYQDRLRSSLKEKFGSHYNIDDPLNSYLLLRQQVMDALIPLSSENKNGFFQEGNPFLESSVKKIENKTNTKHI